MKSKKLSLKKQTIANLMDAEMNKVQGGTGDTYDAACASTSCVCPTRNGCQTRYRCETKLGYGDHCFIPHETVYN